MALRASRAAVIKALNYMICPNCGAESSAPDGHCPSCTTAAPSTRVAAATMTPIPDSPADAETRLSDTPTIPVPHSTGPLQPGTPFGSRYHIIRVLGAGGMGVVYQAWDQELGVAVALKVIRPEVTSDPYLARDVERRFKRELLLAREVTHANVVRIFDLGEIDGIKYITMSYVDGVDLATLIQRDGRLPVRRALTIVRGVVSGLRAAHEAGVVHRDLKPANLIIDAKDHALVMDFGIARSTSRPAEPSAAPADGAAKLFELRQQAALLAEQTIAGGVIGTVEYMAPEQARGETVDQRADIYALGLIVYDMLGGGRRAARSESALVELTGRMQQAPPPIRTINPDVPEPIEHLISRCLQPDPSARFATTKELEAELQRLDEEGNLLPVLRRFSTRQLIGAGVLTLSLLGGTWWLAHTPPAEVQPPPTSVLISDFENLTKDPVFDGALAQAFSIAIERASFITSYRRDRALAVARQLNAGKTLDEGTARLISRREGVKYVLAGSIGMSGSGYTISIKAIDPLDGKTLSTAQAAAKRKDDVLGAVAALASDMREALGDTRARAERTLDAETFTATSVDAMAAYARGQELNYSGRQQEALKAYEAAVRLDPGLARAYSGMGVIYAALKQDAKVQESYGNALKHLDRMTEREKFRTLGGYYLLVTYNYEQAIQNYAALVDKYPADDTGHANLAYAYLNVRNVPKAVEEGRKAIEIYPNNTLQRTNYAMYSMYAGDFKTAMEQANKVLDANPSFEYGILTLANSQVGAGDLDAARRTWDRLAAVSPLGASMANLGRADVALLLGRPREAVGLLIAGAKADEAAGSPGEAAAKSVALAEAYESLGQKGPAATAARKATLLRAHESVLFPAALVLIDTGNAGAVKGLSTKLDGMLQSQTSSYAKLILGALALKENRLGEALDAFRDAQKRHDSWFAHLMLGRAYLAANRFAEAVAEFEACVKRSGEATDVFFENLSTSRYLPPVYYWLGRAQEALGAQSAAFGNYRTFLNWRETADAADAQAADARRRLSGS